MLFCAAVFVLLLLAPLKPSHSRGLQTPDRAMQIIEQFLDRNNDIMAPDDLSNLNYDQTDEPVHVFNSALKVADGSRKWIDTPEQNENSWLRFLKGALVNQKRVTSDRSRRGWNRGCFGLKLDRIGSISGLGC